MIDRRTMITAAPAAVASPASTRIVLAHTAMSRITAYPFSFPALAGARSGSPTTPATAGGQHGLIVRFHAAICRIAGIVDPVSRGLTIYRCSLERLRRTGTGRRHRDRGDRAAPCGVTFPLRGKSRRKGPKCPSVLQMGG